MTAIYTDQEEVKIIHHFDGGIDKIDNIKKAGKKYRQPEVKKSLKIYKSSLKKIMIDVLRLRGSQKIWRWLNEMIDRQGVVTFYDAIRV